MTENEWLSSINPWDMLSALRLAKVQRRKAELLRGLFGNPFQAPPPWTKPDERGGRSPDRPGEWQVWRPAATVG